MTQQQHAARNPTQASVTDSTQADTTPLFCAAQYEFLLVMPECLNN
jgi:hypothetical protein